MCRAVNVGLEQQLVLSSGLWPSQGEVTCSSSPAEPPACFSLHISCPQEPSPTGRVHPGFNSSLTQNPPEHCSSGTSLLQPWISPAATKCMQRQMLTCPHQHQTHLLPPEPLLLGALESTGCPLLLGALQTCSPAISVTVPLIFPPDDQTVSCWLVFHCTYHEMHYIQLFSVRTAIS